MSHIPESAVPPQQHPAPFSPPNDPSDSVQPPPQQHHLERNLQQYPVSPPTSASPSQFDASGASSPHHSASFTPATAPLMSADPFSPSDSPRHLAPGLLDEKYYPRSDDDGELLGGEPRPAHRTSSKHRMADDESQAEPKKRRRTDHDRDEAANEAEMGESVATEKSFAPLYKVSSTPLSISRPHPALNLLSLYGLDSLSASVARKDPVTGEKINKLRKSYEGKIKDLPGRNKASTKENDLFNLLNYPPEEWKIHQVQGKDISGALSADGQSLSEDFMTSLGSALNMTAGPLTQRQRDTWGGIIDLENAAVKPGAVQNLATAKSDRPRADGSGSSPAAEPVRPRRRGTKRNYHDESFEGYEDFAEDGGDMSIDDDDRKSTTSSTARKKRRKETGSASHFSGSLSQFSPSTVSVGGNGSR